MNDGFRKAAGCKSQEAYSVNDHSMNFNLEFNVAPAIVPQTERTVYYECSHQDRTEKWHITQRCPS